MTNRHSVELDLIKIGECMCVCREREREGDGWVYNCHFNHYVWAVLIRYIELC